METKLKEGMRIKLPHSGVFDVTLVNESRAHITPVKKSDGGIGYDMDISPNSEVEILSVIASEAKQSQEELFQ